MIDKQQKFGNFLVPSLVLIDVILLNYFVHDYWFLEEPIGIFSLAALDEVSKRIGQILIVLGVILSIFLGLAVGPLDVSY